MGILLPNVVIAAIKDGAGPNMFLVAALLMSLYLFSWRTGIKLAFFMVVFLLEVLFFIFMAHLDAVVFVDPFRIFSLLYNLIAAVLLVMGIVLLLDWMLVNLSGGKKGGSFMAFDKDAIKRLGFWQSFGLNVLIVLIALTVTIKDVTWPMDPYIVALSNNIFGGIIPLFSFLSLCLYSILRFWVIGMVIIIFAVPALSRRVKMMVAAAFFLAAGSALFYVK